MKKSSTANSRRRGAASPSDILEWHGLYNDRNEEYEAMLRQDALEPWEAACTIYPRPPGDFKTAMEEDDGRMSGLLEKVEVAIKTRKLETFTIHDKPSSITASDKPNSFPIREKKLIPTDTFLGWARKRRLVDERLNGRLQRIRASTKGYSGSEIPSLRADNEILRAAISVLAADYFKSTNRKIKGVHVAKVLERYGEVFFKDGDQPKGPRSTTNLLNHCLKKLQNEFEDINDYKGIRD